MTKEELAAYIQEKFGEKLTSLESGKYDLLYEVSKDNLLEVAQALKEDDNLQFDFLCNLLGADTKEHFEVIYNIASIYKNLRLDFKVILPYDAAEIESVQKIWPAANWYEREMWEMYGIEVKNHNDLKLLLLPDDWDQGFPMRKDWDAPDFVRLPEVD